MEQNVFQSWVEANLETTASPETIELARAVWNGAIERAADTVSSNYMEAAPPKKGMTPMLHQHHLVSLVRALSATPPRPKMRVINSTVEIDVELGWLNQNDRIITATVRLCGNQVFLLQELSKSLQKYHQVLSNTVLPLQIEHDHSSVRVVSGLSEEDKAEYTAPYLLMTTGGSLAFRLCSENDEDCYYGGRLPDLSEIAGLLNQ